MHSHDSPLREPRIAFRESNVTQKESGWPNPVRQHRLVQYCTIHGMEPAEALRAFIEKRTYLIADLDAGAGEIDAWLEKNGTDGEVRLAQIAELAGIVELRRDALRRLADLDDDFLKNIARFVTRNPAK